MPGCNLWIGLGNLTDDPKQYEAKNGKPWSTFTVACTDRYQANDGEWKEVTEFVRCKAWGFPAKAICDMGKKGTCVHLEGRIKTDVKEDDSGKKTYYTYVDVRRLQVCHGGIKAEGAAQGKSSREPGDDEPF